MVGAKTREAAFSETDIKKVGECSTPGAFLRGCGQPVSWGGCYPFGMTVQSLRQHYTFCQLVESMGLIAELYFHLM